MKSLMFAICCMLFSCSNLDFGLSDEESETQGIENSSAKLVDGAYVQSFSSSDKEQSLAITDPDSELQGMVLSIPPGSLNIKGGGDVEIKAEEALPMGGEAFSAMDFADNAYLGDASPAVLISASDNVQLSPESPLTLSLPITEETALLLQEGDDSEEAGEKYLAVFYKVVEGDIGNLKAIATDKIKKTESDGSFFAAFDIWEFGVYQVSFLEVPLAIEDVEDLIVETTAEIATAPKKKEKPIDPKFIGTWQTACIPMDELHDDEKMDLFRLMQDSDDHYEDHSGDYSDNHYDDYSEDGDREEDDREEDFEGAGIFTVKVHPNGVFDYSFSLFPDASCFRGTLYGSYVRKAQFKIQEGNKVDLKIISHSFTPFMDRQELEECGFADWELGETRKKVAGALGLIDEEGDDKDDCDFGFEEVGKESFDLYEVDGDTLYLSDKGMLGGEAGTKEERATTVNKDLPLKRVKDSTSLRIKPKMENENEAPSGLFGKYVLGCAFIEENEDDESHSEDEYDHEEDDEYEYDSEGSESEPREDEGYYLYSYVEFSAVDGKQEFVYAQDFHGGTAGCTDQNRWMTMTKKGRFSIGEKIGSGFGINMTFDASQVTPRHSDAVKELQEDEKCGLSAEWVKDTAVDTFGNDRCGSGFDAFPGMVNFESFLLEGTSIRFGNTSLFGQDSPFNDKSRRPQSFSTDVYTKQ